MNLLQLPQPDGFLSAWDVKGVAADVIGELPLPGIEGSPLDGLVRTGFGAGSTNAVGFWLNWLFSGLRSLVVFTVLGVLALTGELWVGARLK